MPIQQTGGTFNVGRDCTIILVDSTFGRVQLDNVTSFQSAQVTATVKVDRMDGIQLMSELPKGWTGSFQSDRGSSALDTLFAQWEAAWYNNGTVTSATLYQEVVEKDGTTSNYQYDNVALKLDDAGNYKGDASVPQKVSFMANRRRAV